MNGKRSATVRETLRQRLARWAYTMLLACLYPLMPLYLLKRGRQQPAYRKQWAQRFLGATGLPPAQGPRVWVHAVSVGETHAIAPLVLAWHAAHPETEWVFTSTTPTGRETAQHVFRDLGKRHHVYLPYDLPFAVSRFYRELHAHMGWLVETELWPNLLAAAHHFAVRLCLINARVSPRTGEQLGRWPALSQPALQRLSVIAAQTAADAAWFERLGRPVDVVAGNLKFDVQPRPELLAQGRSWRAIWGDAPVVLAASTREGEEPLLLAAWEAHLQSWTGRVPRLLVVPRHPQRFAEVADLFESAGYFVSRRSADFPSAPPEQVQRCIWLGDSMGEMPAYYASADLALMGGSWEPLGGQNLIEACACDCPVLLGPHTFNFAKAAGDAIDTGAALRFENMGQAIAWLTTQFQPGDALPSLRQAATAYAAAHRGATARTVAALTT